MNFDLSKIAGGKLQIKADEAIQRVLENMLDPNIPALGKRSVGIKMTFTQNEERNNVTVDIAVSEKLLGSSPIRTNMYIAEDLDSGEIQAEEYGPQVRGQLRISDKEGNIQTVNEHGVPMEETKVFDFKKKA